MIKAFSWALTVAASIGLVNLPHAIFYQHPELLFSSFYRRDLCQDG